MDRSSMTILVTGATGHQGGAATQHLLEDGWHVRALVRDPEKPASRALAVAGAELAVGDLFDRASLDAALRGAYGVHSLQTPAGAGAEGELTEGRNLVDAAAAAGVKHFVYSSVRGADRAAGLPWVVSKHQIEAYIRELDLPATIWRPVTFMENFLRQRGDILAGHLRGPEAPDTVKQLIAVDDIGRFIALAFREPDAWIGKATEIAGDELTWTEMAKVLSRVTARPVPYEQTEPAAGAMPVSTPDAGGLPPARADIGVLRRVIPDLVTFDEWVHSVDWRG